MMNSMRVTLFIFVLVIGILVVNCAGTPDANPVREAERSYEQIEDDTLVINNAPAELKKAKEALVKAKIAMENDGSQTSINQQALMAMQQVEIAKKKAELKATQDEVQRISKELQQLRNTVNESGRTSTRAEERVRQLTNFEVQQTNRGLVLRFESGNFEQEKAYLKSNAAAAINELANFLEAYPKRNVLIEGHTDNTGSQSFNQQLSEQRANAVRDALISRNIAEARIQAVGLGEQYPRVSNKTEAGRAYNRRVEIIISDRSGTIPARQ